MGGVEAHKERRTWGMTRRRKSCNPAVQSRRVSAPPENQGRALSAGRFSVQLGPKARRQDILSRGARSRFTLSRPHNCGLPVTSLADAEDPYSAPLMASWVGICGAEEKPCGG
jgi:hypothetical protein